jgi:hypothetical protein
MYVLEWLSFQAGKEDYVQALIGFKRAVGTD